jgi:WD40 repeat protein
MFGLEHLNHARESPFCILPPYVDAYETAVEFSPDGKMLASGSSDGTVYLTQVATFTNS